MGLIYCPDCGKQISDQAAACPNCGSPLQKKHCMHCGELIDPDCVICPSCGKQVGSLKQEQSNIVINNSSSASAAAAATAFTGNHVRSLPWYLKTMWIFILGCFTGGIYWVVGIILRINWRSHN